MLLLCFLHVFVVLLVCGLFVCLYVGMFSCASLTQYILCVNGPVLGWCFVVCVILLLVLRGCVCLCYVVLLFSVAAVYRDTSFRLFCCFVLVSFALLFV